MVGQTFLSASFFLAAAFFFKLHYALLDGLPARPEPPHFFHQNAHLCIIFQAAGAKEQHLAPCCCAPNPCLRFVVPPFRRQAYRVQTEPRSSTSNAEFSTSKCTYVHYFP